MKVLIDAILDKGKILDGNILKVDTIINHQIDPVLMDQIGEEFYNHFKDKGITKVITVESSGIAPALMCALKLHVPVLFLKKAQPSTMTEPVTAEVFSYTNKKALYSRAFFTFWHQNGTIFNYSLKQFIV